MKLKRFWYLPVCFGCLCECGQDGDSSRPLGSDAEVATEDAGDSGMADASNGDGGAIDGSSDTGGADAGADSAPPPEVTGSYEAEDAFHAGTARVATSLADYSGTGYLDALGEPAARVIFAVNAGAAGPTGVSLRYQSTSARTVARYVNGSKDGDVEFPSSAAFTELLQTVTLRRGLNTIAYVVDDDGTGAVSLDKLDLENDAGPPARGAIVPFAELEAEDASASDATLLGPTRDATTIAAYASGRQARLLDATGKFVEWVAPIDANGLTLRFSLPDDALGNGTAGSISLYVDGVKQQTLHLSSRRAWLYGGFTAGFGFSNDPSEGAPLMAFIEERFVVPSIQAGQLVRLQRDSEDTGDVSIDLIDLEPIPDPYVPPANAISIVDFGAVAGDDQDDAPALVAAINAASSGGTVWIPPGTFHLFSRVNLAQVAIRGAGPWHSILQGSDGLGGFRGVGDGVGLFDLAIIGDMVTRVDADYDAALDGSLGASSWVQNLWIQGTKVGMWFISTQGAYVSDVRIRDTYADGINFNTNVTETMAEHIHVRSTGDDGLAMWALEQSEGNVFRSSTVRSVYHANGIALYGGTGPHVAGCVISDSVRNGAGIKVSTQFAPLPFAGTSLIENTTILRAGSRDAPGSHAFGAMYFRVTDTGIDAPILTRQVDLLDSSYDAIYFYETNPVQQVAFEDVTIDGAGGYGIHIATPGDGTFTAVRVSNASAGGAEVQADFELTKIDSEGW